MLHCALACMLFPSCVAGVHFRSPRLPPPKYMSADDSSSSLFGEDGLYHDAAATLEEFGSNNSAFSTFATNATSTPPSFCVFSRIIVQELPYVKSFVEHYVHLGVRKFYFVSNMFEQHPRIAKFLRTLAADASTRIVLHSVHVTDADAALNDMELLGHIHEDFVIGVDVDEYWMLPDGMSSFVNLVEAHPNATEFRAQWIMVPNDNLGAATRPYRGFRGANGKWMAKAATLKQIAVTPHKPMFVDAFVEHEAILEAGNLIHFWGRSFLDQLTKGLGQKLHNRAGEDLDEVRQMTSEGKIPERLRMLAFLMSLDRNMTVGLSAESADLITIDQDLEKDIAAELLQSNITAMDEEVVKILDVYKAFRDHVGESMSRDDCPEYPSKGLEKIAPWLLKIQESMTHSD